MIQLLLVYFSIVSDQTTEWTPARIPGCSVQKRVTYRNCRSNSVEDIMATVSHKCLLGYYRYLS